jgi:hypothetical protein
MATTIIAVTSDRGTMYATEGIVRWDRPDAILAGSGPEGAPLPLSSEDATPVVTLADKLM